MVMHGFFFFKLCPYITIQIYAGILNSCPPCQKDYGILESLSSLYCQCSLGYQIHFYLFPWTRDNGLNSKLWKKYFFTELSLHSFKNSGTFVEIFMWYYTYIFFSPFSIATDWLHLNVASKICYYSFDKGCIYHLINNLNCKKILNLICTNIM